MNSLVVSPVFIVAFSGHRPNPDVVGRSAKDLESTQSLILEALKIFQRQATEVGGKIHLLSSVAEGADLAACRAGRELGIPIHVILPLPESDFADDFKGSLGAWEEASSFIGDAKNGESGGSLRIASSSHQRPGDLENTTEDCYADTNKEILYHADALIAVALDVEIPPSSASGAAQVWQDASERKLPRIHIDPLTGKCGKALDLELLTSVDNSRSGIFLLTRLGHHLQPIECHGTAKCLETAQRNLDESANRAAQFVRGSVVKTVILHGSASLLAGMALSLALTYHDPGFYKPALCILAFTELILIVFAEILHRRMHHKGEAWLDCRAAAEFLRPLGLIRRSIDPLDTLIAHHAPQWRRFILSLHFACGRPLPYLSLREAKADYLEQRINDQIQHFEKKSTQAVPRSRRLYKVIRLTSLLALVVVASAALFKAYAWHHFSANPDDHSNPGTFGYVKDFSLYFLPVALPLIAGVLLALRHSLDLGRREHRYGLMIAQLHEVKNELQAAHTPFAFKQVIARVEQILLTERLEFDVAQRIGLEH